MSTPTSPITRRTSSAPGLTNTATVVTNAGTLPRTARAAGTLRNRGLGGKKLSPIASTPSPDAHRASSGRVRPQILIRTRTAEDYQTPESGNTTGRP